MKIKQIYLAVVLTMLCAVRAAWAELPATLSMSPPTAVPGATTGEVSIAELQSRLQDAIVAAEQDYAAFLAGRKASTNLPPGVTDSRVAELGAIKEWLVRTCQNHLADLKEYEAVLARRKDIENQSAAWSGFPDPPPYSVLFVDNLRENLFLTDVKLAAATTTRDMAVRMLDDLKSSLEATESKVRLLNEQIELAKNKAGMESQTWQRDVERVRSRLLMANVSYYETKRRVAEEDVLERHQRLALLQRQLAIAAAQVNFPKADLDKLLARVESDKRQIEQELAAGQTAYDGADRALEKARATLQKTLIGTTTQTDRVRAQQELVEVRNVQIETCRQSLETLRELMDGVAYTRAFWQQRFAMFQTTDPVKLHEVNQRLDKYLARMQLSREYYQKQVSLAISLVTEQNERVRRQEAGDDAALMQEKLDSYQQRESLYRRALRSAENRERLAQYWRASTKLTSGQMPASARVNDWFVRMTSFAVKLWDFEVFKAEDIMIVDGRASSELRPVTIGKIVKGILIFIVGYWIISGAVRIMKRTMVRRLGIEPAIANILRGWIKFLLVLCLAIVGLKYVHIPITVFAFLGGALAIGFGFGMQNLLKNFISGIILLIERPLRVGDMIEVGPARGQVVSIGIRSSVIRNADGIETLIPNSTFLEGDVTNWTYSNRQVRFSIRVGVAYGADTRRVAAILAAIPCAHEHVMRMPEPAVIFEDFGDNALIFSLNYWLDMTPKTDSRIVASDLRHAIGRRLQEAGIAIAYPQRDVHLDATGPLRVELTRGDGGKR